MFTNLVSQEEFKWMLFPLGVFGSLVINFSSFFDPDLNKPCPLNCKVNRHDTSQNKTKKICFVWIINVLFLFYLSKT